MGDPYLDAIERRLRDPEPFLWTVLTEGALKMLGVLWPNMYGTLGKDWTYKIKTSKKEGTATVYHKRLEADREKWEKIFSWHNDGTMIHWVEPVQAQALHWVDKETGEDRFSQGHYVDGIQAKHFAEMADRVLDDFEKTLKRRWKNWIETGR